MRSIKTIGIILKRRNVGEADRILTVYTREEGKITIKAKGVRKISSKRASHIEPLNKAVLSLYKTGGTPVLTEIDTIVSYESVKSNLARVGLAYHICELVDSLCPEGQENEAVFVLLENMLDELTSQQKIGSAIHAFEVALLKQLGYISGNEDLSGAKASQFIEELLERKLKTRQILPQLL
ncbi:MAG: DNA repair protein RecO [Patescibacteria group bacterium]|nr:DNA repair protein RecO [Patescibacteria group bacterium]